MVAVGLKRKSALVLIVTVTAAVLGTFAANATIFPVIGGRGDRQEEVRCPNGHILVGFSGRVGRWIDQLALMCARLQIPGYTTHDVITLSPKGGGGGVPEEKYCERNSGVRGITIYFSERKTIERVGFSCAFPVNGAPSQGLMFGFFRSDNRGLEQACPGSEYATGVKIHYGKDVNALGLICSVIADWPPTPNNGIGAQRPQASEKVDPGMENNTDRPGSDYDRFNPDSPEACQRECLFQRDRCKAWTYVRPGAQGERTRCYLKNAVPPPASNACCISGVVPNVSTSKVTSPGGEIAQPRPPMPVQQTPGPPPPPAAGSPDEPYGAIGDKYAKLGGPNGALGQPTGAETEAPHGGRCHAFRHGTICWHPQIGEAFAVWGSIHDKWAQIGRAEFGYPITDERVTTDGRGRFNHFRGMQYPNRPESSIFYSPQTGAHAIYGAIRDAWAQQGWERGPLGYPTSDEHQEGKYRRVNFERGTIRWAGDTGIEISNQ